MQSAKVAAQEWKDNGKKWRRNIDLEEKKEDKEEYKN